MSKAIALQRMFGLQFRNHRRASHAQPVMFPVADLPHRGPLNFIKVTSLSVPRREVSTCFAGNLRQFPPNCARNRFESDLFPQLSSHPNVVHANALRW